MWVDLVRNASSPLAREVAFGVVAPALEKSNIGCCFKDTKHVSIHIQGGTRLFAHCLDRHHRRQWKVMALWLLRDGPTRFTELKRLMPGVTQKMLTQQLRQLEADGLVLRVVFP